MAQEPMVEDVEPTLADDEDQYLTFALADQTYALDVLDVREIRSWSPPTPLPHAAPEVLGAMNLRGAIIPVVDLRRQLGVCTPEFNNTTGVVVVQAELEAKQRQMGLVVDQVLNVNRLEKVSEGSVDNELTNNAGRFVLALRRTNNDLVILLDLPAIMAASLGDDAVDEPAGDAQ